MKNQSAKQRSFGLGELPLNATNRLTTASLFTKQDFSFALRKVSRRVEKPKPSPKPS